MRFPAPFLLGNIAYSFVTDQEIDGIEMAESHEDEERIDERTWQAEMSMEREELEVNQRY